MVLYKCIYCRQTFIYKGNYTSHNKNINKCKLKLEEQITKYKTYTNEKLLNDLNNLILDESKYKCKDCDKIYNSYNGLKRHKLVSCNKKEEEELIKNSNVSNKITNSNNQIITNSNNQINSNNTQNNITNHINNNIKLVPYDEIKYENECF